MIGMRVRPPAGDVSPQLYGKGIYDGKYGENAEKRSCRGAAGSFVLLNVYGRTAEAGTLAGIRFCVTVIAPSLFIYIVLAKLILGSAAAGWFAKPSQPLFLLLLGFLCGFPTGAVLRPRAVRQGRRGLGQARVVYLRVCQQPQPLVRTRLRRGARLSRERRRLEVFAADRSVVAAEYACAAAGFRTAEERAELAKPLALGGGAPKTLVAAVSESADAMIRICAMITAFACVGTLLNELAGLSGLPAALVSGILEFSGGISLCAGLSGVAGPVLAAALLGWSGICVQMQVRAVAGELLSVGMFTCARVLQAAVMAPGAFFLFR